MPIVLSASMLKIYITIYTFMHFSPAYTDYFSISYFKASTTGRQLPPLSSVLYGIISERRTVLAAQLLLREKSGG
jgi:hypothetical protein